MNAILYIHGKGGNASESEHYKPLFPDCEVIGLDYQTFSDLKGTECGVAITPWETGQEIRIAVEELKSRFENVILIANSIGAFFSMNSGIDDIIQKAYFISPIVDMEKLITDMMKWANVTEQELESKGIIHTDFGEDLSWEYLSYVRSHPIEWHVPTQILYGRNDQLTSIETISDFANKHQAPLAVMQGGEHWFHTDEQMMFLDNWIKGMKIEIATKQDVPALLDLQRKAFGPLCEELGWKDALPLTESLEHAYEEFTKCTTLKVQNEEGEIVGSVNGAVTDDSLYIGRLMVLPEYQQQGIGKLLFREIQSRLPHNRAWLCTCQQVCPPYEFYLREGFKPYKSEIVGPGLTWAYLEKLIGEHK